MTKYISSCYCCALHSYGRIFFSGAIPLGAPPSIDYLSVYWCWRDLTGHGKSFVIPSHNATVLHANNPRSSVHLSGLNDIYGLQRGQRINGRALEGVALGSFISSLRAPHDDCTPQPGVFKLHWVKGINGRALAGVAIFNFEYFLRAPHGDITPPSILLTASLYY